MVAPRSRWKRILCNDWFFHWDVSWPRTLISRSTLVAIVKEQVRGGWLWSGKAAEQATIRVNIDSWPDRPLQLSALSQENNSMLFDISFYVFHFCLFYADELILFRSIREDVRVRIYRVFSSEKRGRWIFQWKYGKYIMWYLVTYI